MPTLSKTRATRKVTLPSYPDSEVEIYSALTTGDFMELQEADRGKITTAAIIKLIKAWNFTQEDGTPTPVDEETLSNLPARDALFLFKESGIIELMGDVKKNTKTD